MLSEPDFDDAIAIFTTVMRSTVMTTTTGQALAFLDALERAGFNLSRPRRPQTLDVDATMRRGFEIVRGGV